MSDVQEPDGSDITNPTETKIDHLDEAELEQVSGSDGTHDESSQVLRNQLANMANQTTEDVLDSLKGSLRIY